MATSSALRESPDLLLPHWFLGERITITRGLREVSTAAAVIERLET